MPCVYPCKPAYTGDTLEMGSFFCHKECHPPVGVGGQGWREGAGSQTPTMYALPVHIVLEVVVGSHSDDASPGHAHTVEDLKSSIAPYLQQQTRHTISIYRPGYLNNVSDDLIYEITSLFTLRSHQG